MSSNTLVGGKWAGGSVGRGLWSGGRGEICLLSETKKMRKVIAVGGRTTMQTEIYVGTTGVYRGDLFKWAYAQTAALEGCLTLAPTCNETEYPKSSSP